MDESLVYYYPSEARIMPLTMLRCTRELPVPGEVVVHQGERVEPTDVVARVHKTSDFRIIDVTRTLRIPRGQLGRVMLKKVGDVVEAKEPLAAKRGLFRRTVNAPAAGEVIAVGNGRVLLEVAPELV